MRKGKSKKGNLSILFLTLVISAVLYTIIGYEEIYIKNGKPNFESSYVIDNLDIEMRYDKENYEVSAVLNNPYAVISGDSLSINKLKLMKKYKFFIDVNGLKEGNYNVYVEHEGISKDLKVETYPMVVNVFLREKEIVNYTPVIEYVGQEKLKSKKLIVEVAELVDLEKVRIRDTQENLSKVVEVKGIVDVSEFDKTREVSVELKVYDKDGNALDDINLIDKKVKVKIPIEKKVTVVNEIVNETVVNEIVVDDKNSKEVIKQLNDKTKEVEDLSNELNESHSKTSTLKVEKETLLSKILTYEKEIENLKKQLSLKDLELEEKDKIIEGYSNSSITNKEE